MRWNRNLLARTSNAENPQFNVHKIIAYIFVALVILSDQSMYILVESLPIKRWYIILAACIFGAIGIILLHGVKKNTIIFCSLFAVYLLIYLLATGISRIFILYVAVPTLCIFCYIYTLGKNGKLGYIAEAFVNLMTIEALISVFFYIFGTLLSILPGRVDLIYDWAEKARTCSSYFYLYFDNTTQMGTIFSIRLMRNTGIFPEAPGHAGMLCYAMIFELLNLHRNPKRTKKRIIILVIAMLTAMSTKGFMVLAICIVFLPLMSNKYTARTKGIICGVASAVAVCAGGIILWDKMGTRSFLVRADVLFAEIKAWQENILFGVGYSNQERIVQYYTVERTNNGLSMGITTILALGGIYMLSLYILSAARYLRIKQMKHQTIEGLFALTVLIWNFFISNCGFSLPFLLFVCIGLCIPEPEGKAWWRIQT